VVFASFWFDAIKLQILCAAATRATVAEIGHECRSFFSAFHSSAHGKKKSASERLSVPRR
jgi:hypothetical protein